MNNDLNATELLDLLNHQWATTKDIKVIGNIGINKALEIKNKIAKDMEDSDFLLPKGRIPMKSVVEYFRIDINYLKKISNYKSIRKE